MTRRQGEAHPIIDLINDWSFCSLLPRGTKTWHFQDSESTIDLVLISAGLADKTVACNIHPTEHGLDFRAIETTLDVSRLQEKSEQAEELLNTFFPPLHSLVEIEGDRTDRDGEKRPCSTSQCEKSKPITPYDLLNSSRNDIPLTKIQRHAVAVPVAARCGGHQPCGRVTPASAAPAFELPRDHRCRQTPAREE